MSLIGMGPTDESGSDMYDLIQGLIYCTLLAGVLWWIPVLGPAVAGYMGGRRVGNEIMGFVVSFIVAAAFFVVVWAMGPYAMGVAGFPEVPADEASKSIDGSQGLVATYLTQFYSAGTSDLDIKQFFVLIVFGIVGGLAARQHRVEVREMISKGAIEAALRPLPRSVTMFEKNKDIGYVSYDSIESEKASSEGKRRRGRFKRTSRTKNPEQDDFDTGESSD